MSFFLFRNNMFRWSRCYPQMRKIPLSITGSRTLSLFHSPSLPLPPSFIRSMYLFPFSLSGIIVRSRGFNECYKFQVNNITDENHFKCRDNELTKFYSLFFFIAMTKWTQCVWPNEYERYRLPPNRLPMLRYISWMSMNTMNDVSKMQTLHMAQRVDARWEERFLFIDGSDIERWSFCLFFFFALREREKMLRCSGLLLCETEDDIGRCDGWTDTWNSIDVRSNFGPLLLFRKSVFFYIKYISYYY